jgi:hypothetical protein
MNITFSHRIHGEPVFTGKINGETFRVIKVLSDIDYGWTPLNYLPGQDGGVADQHWDDIEQFLRDNDTELLKAAE